MAAAIRLLKMSGKAWTNQPPMSPTASSMHTHPDRHESPDPVALNLRPVTACSAAWRSARGVADPVRERARTNGRTARPGRPYRRPAAMPTPGPGPPAPGLGNVSSISSAPITGPTCSTSRLPARPAGDPAPRRPRGTPVGRRRPPAHPRRGGGGALRVVQRQAGLRFPAVSGPARRGRTYRARHDGPASNDDRPDIVDEARTAALLARVTGREPATVTAAERCCWPSPGRRCPGPGDIGALEAGRWADVVRGTYAQVINELSRENKTCGKRLPAHTLPCYH
jgi:hypothetical protein